MILAAHQPQYLPYTGLIDKINRCDVFVCLDDLQYVKNDWHNRNRVRTDQGWTWLSIPVHAKLGMHICDVLPAERGWAARHQKTVQHLYRRSKHHDRLEAHWRRAIELQDAPLSVVNHQTTNELLRCLGIEREVILSSSLGLDEGGSADMRLISLCKRFGADVYLSGSGGKEYMDLGLWQDAGIAVEWQEFAPREYPQVWPGWVPSLSVIDLLLSVDDPAEVLGVRASARPAVLAGTAA